MARWWRFYTDAHRHPKIQQLNNSEFRFWTELLCIASDRNENGQLGTAQTIAKMVSKRARNCQKNLDKLAQLQLLCIQDGRYSVYNWASKQYTSDQSTQRVRAYRERYSNGQRNVSETPPDYRKKDRLQTRNVSNGTGSLPPAPNGVGRSPAEMEADVRHGEQIAYPNGTIQVFVREGTEAWRSWLEYKGAKSMPTNKDQGWFFETEYAPGYTPQPRSTASKNADVLKELSQKALPAMEDGDIPF